MKYAIHLSTFTKKWSDDLVQYIKRAKEIGYDGVEIPLMDIKNVDYSKIKDALLENHIEALCGTGISINTDIGSTDEIVREQGVQYLKNCIDICYQLNSKQLGGVLYAPWGVLKSRSEAKLNYKNSYESLKIVADYAREKNVTLCLEILNRYETYYMNTVEEGLEILKEIKKENVGLHFDTFHAHIEEKNMYDAIVKGENNIKYIHFCENTRGIPLTGQVRWAEVVKGLQEIKYQGWVTIENFVNNDCEVGNDTSIWRQVEKNGDYAAVQGYKNMKTLLEE